MKIGLDIHGVIDTFPFFSSLSMLLWNNKCEIHIITGLKRTPDVDEMLAEHGICFTHYFSIVEALEPLGLITWDEKGLPWSSDSDAWDRAKAKYCHDVGIDLMFDDSDKYRDHFNQMNVQTIFCLVNNPNRVVYNTRK